MLLPTQSALVALDNGIQSLDQAGGTQLTADLTTIKSLADSLLARTDQSSAGSANDPHHSNSAGSVGHADDQPSWINHVSKHDT